MVRPLTYILGAVAGFFTFGGTVNTYYGNIPVYILYLN
jgi:hypothetical protein